MCGWMHTLDQPFVIEGSFDLECVEEYADLMSRVMDRRTRLADSKLRREPPLAPLTTVRE